MNHRSPALLLVGLALPLLVALLGVGCGGGGADSTDRAEVALPPEYQALVVPEAQLGDATARAKGEARFMLYCASCHGADGRGRPHPSAPPIGQDLTDPAWRAAVSPRSVFHVIREGKPGTAMIPIRLPDEDTWDIVAFVLSLAEVQGEGGAEEAAAESTAEGTAPPSE